METVYEFIAQILALTWLLLISISLVIYEMKLLSKKDYKEIKELRIKSRKQENDYLLAKRSMRHEFYLKFFKRN